MTTYYVGPGGNDGSAGTSWGTRFLTLSGAEAKPVAAGDTVYVGPGTYREMLTVAVSGTAGNPITYIGDYLGTNTDNVGGVVRITGSDNDQTATRTSCITTNSNQRNYRTFTGFSMDTTTSSIFLFNSGGTNNILQNSVIVVGPSGSGGVCVLASANNSNNTIQNCVFLGNRANVFSLSIGYGTSQINNSNNLVQNCLFLGGAGQININRAGGTTIKNCSFILQGISNASPVYGGVYSPAALTGGQTITVNNCIFHGCGNALAGQTGNADITEDYNTLIGNSIDRVNVNTGTHSLTYPPLFDPRPWMQLIFAPAASQVVSPFDLASYSQLVDLAGTSPSTTDLRGSAVIGAQREWGALEYNSNYKISGKHTYANYTIGIGR